MSVPLKLERGVFHKTQLFENTFETVYSYNYKSLSIFNIYCYNPEKHLYRIEMFFRNNVLSKIKYHYT